MHIFTVYDFKKLIRTILSALERFIIIIIIKAPHCMGGHFSSTNQNDSEFDNQLTKFKEHCISSRYFLNAMHLSH